MKTLLGGILVAIGVLIAGASGLCSLTVLGGMIGSRGSEVVGLVAVVLFVGGIPFGIGMSLVLVGRALIRSAREE